MEEYEVGTTEKMLKVTSSFSEIRADTKNIIK